MARPRIGTTRIGMSTADGVLVGEVAAITPPAVLETELRARDMPWELDQVQSCPPTRRSRRAWSCATATPPLTTRRGERRDAPSSSAGARRAWRRRRRSTAADRWTCSATVEQFDMLRHVVCRVWEGEGLGAMFAETASADASLDAAAAAAGCNAVADVPLQAAVSTQGPARSATDGVGACASADAAKWVQSHTQSREKLRRGGTLSQQEWQAFHQAVESAGQTASDVQGQCWLGSVGIGQ
ncbi:unnamed protein product, partial [Prorocentrum cordatum]